MIRVSITVPLSSLPGVEVEAQHTYQNSKIDLDTTKLSLVFEGEVVPDFDYEDDRKYERTRPMEGVAKLSKPRLMVERT